MTKKQVDREVAKHHSVVAGKLRKLFNLIGKLEIAVQDALAADLNRQKKKLEDTLKLVESLRKQYEAQFEEINKDKNKTEYQEEYLYDLDNYYVERLKRLRRHNLIFVRWL
ncbi:MAG TPA: hypothetical protein VLI92_01555 [Candidatus Saccharimonadales bacterium]|nr:hypothetical protein [Candidatus Saccharimonadales bacterium]